MNMLLIALVALIARIGAAPQQPRASIEGVVVKLGAGEPLANASIQLNLEDSRDRRSGGPAERATPRDDLHRTTKSDRDGRFMFENVAPGTYRLIATYDGGYVPVEYGQRSPTGQGINFEIAAGQRMTGIQLAMSPTGSIAGRVYDRDGEPIGNAQVMAMRSAYKNGRRTLTIVQTVATDDRGEYRLFWLAPGRYYVSAKPDIAELPVNMGQPNSYNAAAVHITPPMRFGTYEQATSPSIKARRLKTGELVEEMYLPTYYPGTTDPQAAAPVAVAAGTTVGGVDLSTDIGLVLPHHIRGRIIDRATGQPVAQTTVSVVPRTNDPYVMIPTALSSALGIFDVAGVTAGSYQIFARTHAGEGLRVMTGVSSAEMGDKDIENLSIVVTSDFKLSGRFFMEGGSRSFPRIASLTRDPEVIGVDSGGPSFNPPAAADGSFTLEGLVPGDFRVSLQGVPPDGYIKSMRLGNVDVLNDGLHILGPPEALLEIVIGANAGKVEGSVVNAQQQPLSNRTVVLVPDFRLRQRMDLYKVVSTDNAGRFRMQGVTPGEYKLFAWDDVETGAWQDPAFISTYENGGRPIHINESTNENLQLPVIP
jgi:protocatechuate 3,4-dioxygenase beta subunit